MTITRRKAIALAGLWSAAAIALWGSGFWAGQTSSRRDCQLGVIVGTRIIVDACVVGEWRGRPPVAPKVRVPGAPA